MFTYSPFAPLWLKKAQKALSFFVRPVYLFAFCAFVVKKSAEGAKVFCATCLLIRLLRLCG
jgi:hypothetical protein